MRVWLSVLILSVFVACEPKPTPEQLEVEERAAEAARATPSAKPSPKPGEWMLKNYKNPLDPPKKATPR